MTDSRHALSLTVTEIEAIITAMQHARDTYTDRLGNPLMKPAHLDELLDRLHANLRAIQATDYAK